VAEELMRMDHWWTDGHTDRNKSTFGENFLSATLIGCLTTSRIVTLNLTIL